MVDSVHHCRYNVHYSLCCQRRRSWIFSGGLQCPERRQTRTMQAADEYALLFRQEILCSFSKQAEHKRTSSSRTALIQILESEAGILSFREHFAISHTFRSGHVPSQHVRSRRCVEHATTKLLTVWEHSFSSDAQHRLVSKAAAKNPESIPEAMGQPLLGLRLSVGHFFRAAALGLRRRGYHECPGTLPRTH